MSKIFITGCSSGIGSATATLACERGHEVVATMRELDGRNADKAARLRAACAEHRGKLHVIELDVTDDASVSRGVSQALELCAHVDAVIHNAGVGSIGLVEPLTTAQLQHLFNVNVFGVHRVNRALLPHMRARGSGLVLLVSSSIGRILLPFLGVYGPSKFALEAMGECLHAELRPSGVDVTIVEAGPHATDFFTNALHPEDTACVESYGEQGRTATTFWQQTMAGGPPMPSPDVLATAMLELVEAEQGSRPQRKVVDAMLGPALESINQALGQITAQVYAGMGVA